MKCNHCDNDDLESMALRKYPCYYCNDTGEEIKAARKAIVIDRFIYPARERVLAKIEELKRKRLVT